MSRDIDEEQYCLSETNAARKGYITDEQYRQAYLESLQIVLDHVENLINEIDGKSVVSSDHGQMLGERYSVISSGRIYGHPRDLHTKNLCIVPWLEAPYNKRRKIIAENPIDDDKVDEEVVHDRLKSLGYKPEEE